MAESTDVGIIDFAVYIPRLYVSLTELERWDEVSAGKYTIGLGQIGMAVCTDREDVCSLALTAVRDLVHHAGISFSDIGRLDVGTESLVDKSKSVKSVLMQLFKESGNTDVEGLDTMNACYGGTAALLNAVDWMESSAWDGRFAVVVMGDVAMYSEKSARPTGGAGATAFLLGPNAPLVIESAQRASAMSHQYDFYKPYLASDFPVVDGKLSIQCYFEALLNCYDNFKAKQTRFGSSFLLSKYDFALFHSPFSAMVRKAFALLNYRNLLDIARDPQLGSEMKNQMALTDDKLKFSIDDLRKFHEDKAMQSELSTMSAELFKQQSMASQLLSQNIGNSYTASLYCSLASALSTIGGQLKSETTPGKDQYKFLLFSYGSGYAASMFSMRLNASTRAGRELVARAHELVSEERLTNDRLKISPRQFEKLVEYKKLFSSSLADRSQGIVNPILPASLLPRNCSYLEQVDGKRRRKYMQKSTLDEFPVLKDVFQCE